MRLPGCAAVGLLSLVALGGGTGRALPLVDEKCADGNDAVCRRNPRSAGGGRRPISQEHLLLQLGHKARAGGGRGPLNTREPSQWGSLARPVVQVQGRQLHVDRKPFHIKGVDWSPVAKGEDRPGKVPRHFVERDVALMAEAGINAVRVYDPLSDRLILDLLWEKRIFVVPTLYMFGDLDANKLKDEVNRVRDHPAILMWALGNEWNYNGFYVGLPHEKCVQNIKAAVATIRAHDDSRPIATVYGGMPPKWALDELPEIDVWGLNYYHGLSFERIFEHWGDLSEKPLYLAEYGADAWNAVTGQEDDPAQAEATATLTADIAEHSSVLGGVCLGGFLFEWSDEWWKDRAGSLDKHDVGGIAPGGGPWPDLTFNEEWWGVVDIDRKPRAAYYAYKEIPVPTPVLADASSTPGTAAPSTTTPPPPPAAATTTRAPPPPPTTTTTTTTRTTTTRTTRATTTTTTTTTATSTTASTTTAATTTRPTTTEATTAEVTSSTATTTPSTTPTTAAPAAPSATATTATTTPSTTPTSTAATAASTAATAATTAPGTTPTTTAAAAAATTAPSTTAAPAAPAATTTPSTTAAAPPPTAATTAAAVTAGGSLPTSGALGASEYPQAISVVSTWSIWTFEEMARVVDEPLWWYLDAEIRYPRFEEFQIVVDHDWSKVIHPQQPLAEDTSIPIVGPDGTGTGYNFLIRGPAGNKVRLRLRFASPDDMVLDVVNVTYPLTHALSWHTAAPASASD